MAKFKVFHLAEGVDTSFFLTPRPRYDPEIAETYCITRNQFQKALDTKDTLEITPDKYMLKCAKTCDALWAEDKYIHVANVKAIDIVQAQRNTNHINGHWFLTVAKGVEVVSKETLRATRAGDVIEDVDTGDLFMVYAYTFLNIKTGKLIE